jgi:hypothetical protein
MRLMSARAVVGHAAVRHAVLAIALAWLAGCTGAQVESLRMQNATRSVVAASAECMDGILGNPERQDILTKAYLGKDGQIPLAMLTDPRRPTQDDIRQIYRLHGDIQDCRKVALDGAAKVHPLIVMLLIETYAEGDKAYAGITSGLVTFGQFNQYQKDIFTNAQMKLTQVVAQIDAQLANRHQFELQQRAQAANAFSQWTAQQQRLINQQRNIDALTRRRPIACRYLGDQLVCAYL